MTQDEIKGAVALMQQGASITIKQLNGQTGTYALTGLSKDRDNNEMVRVKHSDGTFSNFYLTDIKSVS